MAKSVIVLTLRDGTKREWKELAIVLATLKGFRENDPEGFEKMMALFKSGENDLETWEEFHRLYSCGDKNLDIIHRNLSIEARQNFFEDTRRIALLSFDGTQLISPVKGMTLDQVLKPLENMEKLITDLFS